jgi:hypothetical protein
MGWILLISWEAAAAVAGFQINRMEGVGALKDVLDDRLTKEYKINLSDCQLYLGDSEPLYAEEGDDLQVAEPQVEEPAEDLVEEDLWVEDAADDSQSFRRFSYYGKADSVTTPRILVKWSVGTMTGYDYAIKVGTCSDTGNLTDEETTSCRYLVSRRSLSTYTNNELYVNLWDLLPDGCSKGSDGESSLYFFFQYQEETYTKKVQVVAFEYDFNPPVAPSGLTVAPGEGNLKTSWSDESNSETVTYNVYWKTSSFAEATKHTASSKTGISTKNYTITGLSMDTSYFIAASAVDDFDNESVLTEVLEESPVLVDDFWEHYKKAGGQEEGGYCFVATATWGTPMSPWVTTLRLFRDRYLLTSAWGRSFVDWYYLHSPALADGIRGSAVLKGISAVVLAPLVGLAAVLVHGSLLWQWVLCAAAAAVVVWVRRRRAAVSARRAS